MDESASPAGIGVLSDTHGRMDPRVFDRFEGVGAVIHAGDVRSREILIDLQILAPTWAVLGNTDQGGDCGHLPLQAFVETGGLRIFVSHGHLQADPNRRIRNLLEASKTLRPDLIVVGHSHRPYVGEHDGVLFLNPGSASSPRYGHPKSVALVTASNGKPNIRLVDLDGNEIQSDGSI